MSMFPILENVALAKVPMWKEKNSNDLMVICLLRQPSKFVYCNKWPGSGVPDRGSYLCQAAMEHVNMGTDSGIDPKQDYCATSSSVL